MLADLRL